MVIGSLNIEQKIIDCTEWKLNWAPKVRVWKGYYFCSWLRKNWPTLTSSLTELPQDIELPPLFVPLLDHWSTSFKKHKNKFQFLEDCISPKIFFILSLHSVVECVADKLLLDLKCSQGILRKLLSRQLPAVKVNFEHISQLGLVFLLLTFSR